MGGSEDLFRRTHRRNRNSERKYQELGTFTATGYPAMESAKMHNALRNKAAPLGANAVIITDSGQIRGEFGVQQLWVNGVAVRWNDQAAR